jgi:hypothetical protein
VYAFITSILLLTLLSRLHCQPGVIGRVSLEPVANVLLSFVRKVFPLLLKSLTKLASLKPAGSGSFAAPAAVKSESQSIVWMWAGSPCL